MRERKNVINSRFGLNQNRFELGFILIGLNHELCDLIILECCS